MPLAHHAHPFIVEDEDLHRQAILRCCCHFLDVHLDRCLAGDIDHKRVGMAHLRANRGRQAIAHGTKAAAGQPLVWRIKMEMLRRPHLMLANFGCDNRRFILCGFKQTLNRILRHDFLRAAGIIEAINCPPAGDA